MKKVRPGAVTFFTCRLLPERTEGNQGQVDGPQALAAVVGMPHLDEVVVLGEDVTDLVVPSFVVAAIDVKHGLQGYADL